MIAEKEGEDNTAEATKVVHAHVTTNELEELMAWIGVRLGRGGGNQGEG
jgi:hypothetical protein